MIEVVALTSGADVPSSRFRVRQYIGPLRERGIAVHEHIPPFSKYASSDHAALARFVTVGKIVARLPGVLASRGAKVTWLEREIVAGQATLESLAGHPPLLDVGDALWLEGRAGFSEKIGSLCDGVLAGNLFLAEHYRNVAPRIWVVPTCVCTDVWVPRAARRRGMDDWLDGECFDAAVSGRDRGTSGRLSRGAARGSAARRFRPLAPTREGSRRTLAVRALVA